MLIKVENTPNPLSLKFVPEGLVSEIAIEINNSEEAIVSPLAGDLFKIDGIKKVFLGQDFISVTIDKESNWSYLRPQIVACISDYFNNNLQIIDYNLLSKSKHFDKSETYDKNGIEADIIELIEERIRPAITMDGGDVIFKGFQEGKVYLQLVGACAGCPSSSITLKNGIENMLKYFIPEVKEVISVE